MNRIRITFDFDNEQCKSYGKLVYIICSSHLGSVIDIFGFMNETHGLLFNFIKLGVIVIDECANTNFKNCAPIAKPRQLRT